MWRGWRKWIFFIHSFLYVRHRCTLDAIIIQYLRWVQEMRWRLFCSVHPQFSVLWFSLQISGYCSCCPVSLTEKEPQLLSVTKCAVGYSQSSEQSSHHHWQRQWHALQICLYLFSFVVFFLQDKTQNLLPAWTTVLLEQLRRHCA